MKVMTLGEFWDQVGALPPDTPLLLPATERGLKGIDGVTVQSVAQVREATTWAGPYDTDFHPMEEVVGNPFLAIIVR